MHGGMDFWIPQAHPRAGLPISPPDDTPPEKAKTISQKDLTHQARQYGFDLTVCVPPQLHKRSFEPELWQISDEVRPHLHVGSVCTGSSAHACTCGCG